MSDPCGAKKRDGNPCGAAPAKGAKRCGRHGGSSPQSKAAAARRLAEKDAQQQMEKAMTLLGIADKDIDPAKALLEEIGWTYAHVQWLRGKVQELEPATLVYGESGRRFGVGPEGPVDVTDYKAEPSVWYQMYLKEREHLAKVSALALKAGIEERKIRLAESQGEMVASALQRILNALNLSPEQLDLVPVIVPRELRALASLE